MLDHKDKDAHEHEKRKKEQEERAKEFLQTVESLIRKSQKDSWLIHSHDHPFDK